MALGENLFLKRMWLTFIGDLIIRIDLYLETYFSWTDTTSLFSSLTFSIHVFAICIELSPEFLTEVWIGKKIK